MASTENVDVSGALVAQCGGAGMRYTGDSHICTAARNVVRHCSTGVSATDVDLSVLSGLAGTVRNRIFLGEHTEYLVHAPPHGDLLALVPRQLEVAGGFAIGDPVGLSWPPGAPLVLAPADPPSPPEPALSPAPTTGREAA